MSLPPVESTRARLVAYWPVYGLRLESPRLTMEMLSDDDLPELIEATLAGIHDPERMPFAFPWTDAPPDALVPNTLRHYWESRSRFRPEAWSIPFGVRHDGLLCGIQEIEATKFALLRTVSTGSWLGRAFQGRGFGTEMRASVLQFAFDHLAATRAESAAFTDNPTSLNVSAKLGYQPDGSAPMERRPGEVAVNQRLVVTPETFRRPDWSVRVSGLHACGALLGLPTQ
jgi:RimJ/RimL family protein N-acetyltransferase